MSDLSSYSPANKLLGKVALVTGAGSGVGRAVAMAFAMEGAGGRRARRLHANVTHDVLGLDAYGLLEAWNDSASR